MKWAPSAEHIQTLATGYNRIIETTKERRFETFADGHGKLNEDVQVRMAKVLAEALLERGCPQEELVAWTRVIIEKAADERKLGETARA